MIVIILFETFFIILRKDSGFFALKDPKIKKMGTSDGVDIDMESYEEMKALADEFINLGYDIVTGGTDTHIVLIDLTSKSISGKKAEKKLTQEKPLATDDKDKSEVVVPA